MTFTELKAKYNFPLPEYAEYYYADFIASYDRSKPVLSLEDASFVADTAKIPEEAKAELLRCANAINSDDDAHICAAFLCELTIYKRKPWVNYIYQDDHFTVEGLTKQQVGWVIVATMLSNTLINKKPPADLNEENLNAFRGYTQNCFNVHGHWGITEWHWNMLCASGCMFMFGILKFVPSEFTGDFPVITNGREYISLAGNEFFIGKEGELVDCEEKSVGKTSFYEDDEKYVAHVVSKSGVVDLNPTEFPKREWSDFLRGGSHTIDIHIPAKVEYTPEKFKEAFKLALEFFKNYYPDHETKAFACYSWILSAQLKKVMAEDSNILRVNSKLHLLPMIGTFNGDIMFIRKGSSLQQRIEAECAKGTEFHFGVMYSPISELEDLDK
ncbi:MAG: hypothetical protein J6R49_02735 [Clostridia bacterium]|nr:hypothetical protein [Clostridia bacterium]